MKCPPVGQAVVKASTLFGGPWKLQEDSSPSVYARFRENAPDTTFPWGPKSDSRHIVTFAPWDDRVKTAPRPRRDFYKKREFDKADSLALSPGGDRLATHVFDILGCPSAHFPKGTFRRGAVFRALPWPLNPKKKGKNIKNNQVVYPKRCSSRGYLQLSRKYEGARPVVYSVRGLGGGGVRSSSMPFSAGARSPTCMPESGKPTPDSGRTQEANRGILKRLALPNFAESAGRVPRGTILLATRADLGNARRRERMSPAKKPPQVRFRPKEARFCSEYTRLALATLPGASRVADVPLRRIPANRKRPSCTCANCGDQTGRGLLTAGQGLG